MKKTVYGVTFDYQEHPINEQEKKPNSIIRQTVQEDRGRFIIYQKWVHIN